MWPGDKLESGRNSVGAPALGWHANLTCPGGSQLGALVGVTVEADEVTRVPFWVIKGAGSFHVKSQFPLTHRMASAFIQKQEGPQ